MRHLLVAIELAALAVVAAPTTRAADDIDPTPWPPAIVRVASLGRPYAAADVAWLKTVQLLGSDSYAVAGYPKLEAWVDLITRLDPSFEEPYFFGATLLVTNRERAPAINALLERGEQAFPHTFAFPMMRGFLAQFGLLDARMAAEHYRRASMLQGAPPYLTSYAARLEKEGASCATIMSDLKELASSSSSAQAKALGEQRFQILEYCFAGLIRRTAVSLRMNEKIAGAFATLAEVEAELGAPVPRPPDRCWELKFDTATLVPCPPGAPTPGPTPAPTPGQTP
jgi:hypothetical protein